MAGLTALRNSEGTLTPDGISGMWESTFPYHFDFQSWVDGLGMLSGASTTALPAVIATPRAAVVLPESSEDTEVVKRSYASGSPGIAVVGQDRGRTFTSPHKRPSSGAEHSPSPKEARKSTPLQPLTSQQRGLSRDASPIAHVSPLRDFVCCFIGVSLQVFDGKVCLGTSSCCFGSSVWVFWWRILG